MRRPRLTYADVVATLCLVLVVGGGGAYAASRVMPRNSVGTRQLRKNAVTGAKVKDGSLSGADVDASTLGRVPAAAHADLATRAETATSSGHATSADTATTANQANSASQANTAKRAATADLATNSEKLAGAPPSDYKQSCPSNLMSAGDLCFEFEPRPAADYATALVTCARAQLRLPDDGELALVFDHLGAGQGPQWVAGLFFNPSATAPLLQNSPSRTIEFNADSVTRPHPYRCVTSPSDAG
jgi:hypothetical protein